MNNLKLLQENVLYDSKKNTEYRKGDRIVCRVDGNTYIGTVYNIFTIDTGEIVLSLVIDEVKWIGRNVNTILVSIMADGIQKIEHIEGMEKNVEE
jgi:hypothetical protein